MLTTKERIAPLEPALDEIDELAAMEAQQYVEDHSRDIYMNPADSVNRLFEFMSEVYSARTVHQRTYHGDDEINSTYIATRTPDTQAIDEIYSEHTAYTYDTNGESAVNVQRAVTLFDGDGGWRRIILVGDELRVVDHNGESVTGQQATSTIMDFTFRTNQAISTYRGRSAEDQKTADIDAKRKLEAHGIYERRGLNLGSWVLGHRSQKLDSTS